jgi:S-adenosylmethionine hydrolase
MAIVTLTTDFGLEDHYAAVMKVVILRKAPRSVLVDVTHYVPKFNISHGAVILRQIVEWFPAGTVHLVVVDPGVGSDRAVAAFRYNGQYVVCPDNGLITLVHRAWPVEAARRLDEPGKAYLSTTFHGRDIMAPAAGHLAAGGSIEQLGVPAEGLELLDLRAPEVLRDGTIRGQVMYVDSFGNLVTNIHRNDLARRLSLGRQLEVHVGERRVGPIGMRYADVPVGEGMGLLGSSDMLEISVHGGNAAKTYEAREGTPVTVK